MPAPDNAHLSSTRVLVGDSVEIVVTLTLGEDCTIAHSGPIWFA